MTLSVCLAANGKFHHFDLARELHHHGVLETIFTSYPRWKLRDEAIPAERIDTYPWWHTPYMGFRRRDMLGAHVVQQWEWIAKRRFDGYVAGHLPPCDVFVALSGSGLASGRAAQRAGARYVCDRGSTHIREQDRILREEHERWGLPYAGIDPRVIDCEEAEYAQADAITVPSTFNLRTFEAQGVPAGKLHQIPYGVNLERFQPTAKPDPARFDVLFVGAMSLRKGVPDLLAAYRNLRHPQKALTLAGAPSDALISQLKRRGLWVDGVRVIGHVPQAELKHLMSRSHVLVLPSVEEGLAMVQAQAMACACPVLATHHTGAEDLYEDGVEGYIVPPRDSDALADRLQRLADDPQLRDVMGQRALERVRGIGGWRDYGAEALALYRQLANQGPPPSHARLQPHEVPA